MIIVLGIIFVTVALLGAASHIVDSRHQAVIVAGALARPLLLMSVPGAVLLALAAGWIGGMVGAAALAAAAGTQVPLWRHRFRPKQVGEIPFTVLHANVLLGKADTDAIVALVDRHEPDVLTIVELTPHAHRGLLDAGLRERLPYSFVSTAAGGNGTGIYSRHPLTDEERHDGYVTELLSSRVAVPGGPKPLVFAVHPVPPWPRHPEAWVRELAAIRQMLAKVPDDDGPVVVAGDFNATFDHKRYRDLVSGRYRDAAIEVGAGHLATYHADLRIPPLIAIDHILVRDAAVTEVGLVDLPGSDHRGIRASLLL
ncbi:endonuclease/exonuclease/phosphatase family protein [Rhodococcus sp. G-MC3]|uniref:endonuclease/exonuclease/phosphatase family protein n=1 Tax=Rhodococcus sp. G-MC3 TaxID=3046209 RepID=UPI0024B91983|nr:endonuclease/exonuclease/phosphatase family protein [Rhodococcus sp. G-MC3]MDJ0392190.1 endonuclease/exonuclease/phosphatase family protein [Rhodococcus sp. G-MC3]